MFGSVATSVLTAAPLPVMLVGPHVAGPDIGSRPYRILVTSDGSSVSEAVAPALRKALERAPTGSVEARFLRVYEKALGDPPDDIGIEACHRQLSALKGSLPELVTAEIEVRELVKLGGVDTAILGTAMEHQVDAIWMGTHGRSFRQHVLLGSVAIQVLGRGSIPVVLVRAIP
jgi:nucleotide-binding universal stress UspA family protein